MYESRNKHTGLKVLVLLAVFAAGSLAFARFYTYNQPCARPISYSLGSFDSRFRISQQDFLSAIYEASQVWEQPISKDLFQLRADGDLEIHLIYDSRQEATERLKNLDFKIENTQASYYSLKAKYDSEVAAYKSQKASYDAQVQYWNSQGGAPQDEYEQLKAQQTELNQMVNDINAMASTLNSMAKQLNLNVANYNDIGESRGEEFEEGVYISDSTGERIEIYEFQNRDQLVRLLAHELGHALGLEHVEDPNAIMYRLNSAANEKLTSTDLVELKTLCRLES